MKTCPKCGECKPLSGFSKDNSSKDGLKSQCRLCRAQSNKRWSETNRDKRCESSKRWRETHYEASREANKRWYEANRKLSRELSKQWKQNNPDKRNTTKAKRRAAKLQRTPCWLTKDQLDEIETFYTVALAFRLFTGLTYHVDHIVPLQGKNVSGLHVPWNLRVIPETDNLKKSNLFED